MRNRTTLILSILLMGSCLTGYSQISVELGYRQSTVAVNTTVPIIVSVPEGNTFSTREFSSQFPSAKIPVEELHVNYPNMQGATDTIGILWFLKPEYYSGNGEVNIIIIGIGADTLKTFYIDNNNDRTFADNEDKFMFDSDVEKRVLEIKILGSYYNYTLMNPDYAIPAGGPSRTGYYAQVWKSSAKKPSVSLDVSLITGGGDAQISFVPLESIVEKYQYNANIVGCLKPTIGIDFSWYNFHLIINGAFERLQYDETVLYAYSSTIQGNKQRFYDRGNWPTSKLHGGIAAEYDFRVFKFYVAPVFRYSVYKNIDKNKFDKSVTTAPDGANYHDMHSKEAGLKLKIPVAEKTILYINYMYSQAWFDASEFLPSYDKTTYLVDYKQNYFGIGIKQRLFR